MNIPDYIKVTPVGESRSVVLLSTNRDFYLSQGAQISEPTQEEILEAFPELKHRYMQQPQSAQEYIECLEQAVVDLQTETKALRQQKKTSQKVKDAK